MILEILGSSAVGTLIGGVFGWLNKREERELMKLKFDQELSMLKAKTDAQVEVSKLNIQETEIAGKLAIEKGEVKAFTESQKSTGWGELIKQLIRPIVLGLLMYQSFIMFTSLDEIVSGMEGLDPDQVADLYRVAILSIFSLTGTAIGWYFSARTSKQFDRFLQ